MDLYFVLGNPIGHSRSPFIHQYFSKSCNQDISYQAKLVPIDSFRETVDVLKKKGFSGCNITVPFKEQAFELADKLSDRAKLAGAVNTFAYDGTTLYGDNTDGAGLVKDLYNQKVNLIDSKVLIIGAGGASRGIILPILSEKPQRLVIANRTLAKADKLVTLFKDFAHCDISASGLETIEGEFDLVINASSSSLKGDIPPIPKSIFSNNCFVYDLMYGSEPTVFMKFSESLGCQTSDGLGMLVEQAAESFLLWRGIRPNTEDLIKTLRAEITQKH